MLHVREILIGNSRRSCKVFLSKGSDHFEEKTACDLSRKINRVALNILENISARDVVFPNTKIVYVSGECRFFLSSFLKIIPRTEGFQSDLTGDGGLLISNFIREIFPEYMELFGSVIDIGGQDSDCLENYFSEIPNRTLVEINVVAPFISRKTNSVNFYLGNLESYFDSEMFQQTSNIQSERLFLASNFINVFEPDEGWKKLEFITSHMRPGDFFGITTLSIEQANELVLKNPNVYSLGIESDGICQLKQNDSFYKSVVSEKFTKKVPNRLRTAVVASKTRPTTCKIRKSDGSYVYTDIIYSVTILQKV